MKGKTYMPLHRRTCSSKLGILQRKREIDSITDSMDMNVIKLQEIVEGIGDGCVTVHEAPMSQTQLSD